MKVRLFLGDVSKVSAEALICPVDGDICILGGSAAATALKNSFDPEERDELFAYLEKDVKRLCPIPQGDAMVIEGKDVWEWLVVIAALPHHVNDCIITENHYARILEKAIVGGVHASVERGIQSIAMTVIGSSYRLPAEACIRSAVNGMSKCRRDDIEIIWSFLDEGQLKCAANLFSQLGMSYTL